MTRAPDSEGAGKIFGPFWPYNRSGLPIVLKNGIPAWMVAEPRRTAQEPPHG